jgi:mannosyl-oligosaccharide glucosidase
MTLRKLHYGFPRTIAVVLALVALSFAASSDLEAFERSTNQSLLWGPYKPNLYFGVRPRIPDGLSMGLLWSRVEDYQSVQNSTQSIDDEICEC